MEICPKFWRVKLGSQYFLCIDNVDTPMANFRKLARDCFTLPSDCARAMAAVAEDLTALVAELKAHLNEAMKPGQEQALEYAQRWADDACFKRFAFNHGLFFMISS
jgi:predicted transcriptional regulator of viral defense system